MQNRSVSFVPSFVARAPRRAQWDVQRRPAPAQGITHQGSRENLLGKNPSDEDVLKYSLENQVNAQTPQAFIMLSADDDTVPAENSIAYSRALIASKVPVAMFMYPTGGHGWGYRDDFKYKRQWTGELEKWFRERILK